MPVSEPVLSPRRSVSLSRTTLSGKFVSLVPLEPARDVSDLYTSSHGSEEKERLWAYMAYGPFADARTMAQWLQEQAVSEDPLFFTVVEQVSHTRVGVASFANNVPPMRRIELAHIWYGSAYQRTAINTEAVYIMLCHAFEKLMYRRVEWKCDALNQASRQAAIRLGFTYEGVFKKHMIVKGRNRDTAWFAMTDDNWPSRKENLEAWLYADGLDGFTRRHLSLNELNKKRGHAENKS
ncbi:MAG: GNAT family N-acetyltransferase [Acidiferrobacterales bacterium]